jgi:uncharacterized protein (TIGR02453 family)
VGFSGWPPEAVAFFEGLQADNTKAYWTANRGRYEESVRGPLADLLEDLGEEFGPARIARPYRDMRFAAGRSPYKTEIYASFDRGGYVNFSADGLRAALGYVMMSPAQLDRYRRAVDGGAAGPGLAGVVARLRAEGIEVSAVQPVRTAPRGYPADHPRIGLLRGKGLICWQDWPVAPWLHTAAARDRVVGFFHTAAPLHQWLDQHVGADPD